MRAVLNLNIPSAISVAAASPPPQRLIPLDTVPGRQRTHPVFLLELGIATTNKTKVIGNFKLVS